LERAQNSCCNARSRYRDRRKVAKLPIDLSQMRFVVRGAPTPKTDFDSGEEVVKDGVVQWVVPLLMGDGAESVDLKITVAGDPGLKQLDEVTPLGLAFHMVSKGGQTITWWSAESLGLASSAARSSSRKGAGE